MYLVGPKRGQPLAHAYRAQMKKTITRYKVALDRHKEHTRIIETEPDALRAWGLYSSKKAPVAAQEGATA